MLAVLVAILIGLAWYNSYLIRHKQKLLTSPHSRSRPVVAHASAPNAQPQLPEFVKVLRENVFIASHFANQIAISPDTNWIAYFSRDELWCQRLPNGPPIKLEDRHPKSLGVAALHWDLDSERVFYAMQLPGDRHEYPTIETYVASCEKRCAKLTTLNVKRPDRRRGWYTHTYHLTEDGVHVVGAGFNPLIWDVASEQLVVCPFSKLAPSPTSDQWLGVEIDTNQLVVTNGKFEIQKRFEYFDNPSDNHLNWSPDGRFASLTLFRNRGNVTPARIDLQTGQSEEITRRATEFTGHRGELVEVTYSKKQESTVVKTLPISGRSRFNYVTNFPNTVRVLPSTDHRYAAIANITTEHNRPPRGLVTDRWHIVHESGSAWALADLDPSLASFTILGFANEGKNVIASGKDILVAIPIEQFAKSKSAVGKE